MATKTKTSEQSVSPVEKKYSDGLELFHAGKLDESAKAFEFVLAEGAAQERLNLVHSARGYLTAIKARHDAKKTPAPDSPEMAAQMRLNEQDPDGARVILEKALQANPDRAILHYLDAVACAQLDQVQASADALARAINLDPDVLFQFRLESDFDGLRQQAPFAVLLKG
jgi:tetratricopeptide (TPR) repeat protein